jgi:hypothetical protein
MSKVQRFIACAFVLTAQPAAFGLAPEIWGSPTVVVYAALAVLVAGFRRELPPILEARPATTRPTDGKQSERASPSPLERRPPPVVH